MKAERPPSRLRSLPASALAPSFITICSMLAGLTSIRFSFEGKWELAIVAIVVAALCDGMDGSMARLLNSTSRFGAELDSLADFLSFGVAPALLVHQWAAHEAQGLGWAAVLFFATCAAMRLARFNAALEPAEPEPEWRKAFFVGVPAPAGGGLALFWVFVALATGSEAAADPLLNAGWLVLVGLLMISRVSTYSVKKARLRPEAVLPTLLAIAVVAAAVISLPWLTLVALSGAYLLSLPLSMRSARRLAAADAAARPRIETEGDG
jgi:CDP-diacylglycerol--serine O-phosphatidyltransferase